MKTRVNRVLTMACVYLILAATAAGQHEHMGQPQNLGTVNFPISCDAGVRQQFGRAVALLHSFWYQQAAQEFAAVAKADPACGMAYWGIAMTHYHPLWEAPSPGDLKQGQEAAEKAKSAGAKTERERDYISAVAVFYKDFDKLDHRTRALAYEKAMEQLQSRYPDDREAEIFYSLALRATAPPSDKTYVNQKKAGAILEKIFTEEPNHPGVAHYIIHCYDYPTLANRALDAARRYAKIAPDSPHALHMPSHIFTRLGLWQESIESNLASEAAARKYDSPGDELHARDYLVYAYLQEARDREARRVFAAPMANRQADPQYFAGLYSIASMPARYSVERHQWKEAAALQLPPGVPPAGRYTWTEANIYFARALGAARTGDQALARDAIGKLASFRETILQAGDKYWAEQLEIQGEIATAWLILAEGKQDEALKQMRVAADHEDRTDKHPVTPGVILPARELLGDMLLELKQPAQALPEYEAVLRAAPNRFNAIAGAARAAELSGVHEKAKGYYTQLVDLCRMADGDRPELRHARKFLAGD